MPSPTAPTSPFNSTERLIFQSAWSSNWKNGEDLFLIAEDFQRGGGVVIKALVKPLVNLIWLSGFVFVAGALIALWPDAREERRLVARYGAVPAEA